ncbi:MAG: tRNA (guanosine(37)-N1)-methyltransferase TrmD [Bacteroidia bacterium]|nr:tRNA (guanosine(37)-N1)-methyltransferase TrmD [Bacteroidia bacterium]MDW8157939.1 tRNA (guanosine(37)-N1)-methyltransferase TrmD [Bacteroidia bacterium]
MRVDVITCVPFLLESPLQHSILQRAQEKGIVTIAIHDLRDFTNDKHRQVDDYPFGGGPGMLLKIEPIVNCLRHLQKERTYEEIIYLTPEGETFNQKIANYLSGCQNIILLCGHYKGVDQRVRDHFITRELSIGDYVLSGGELAAMVVIDAVIRLLPGVLGDETSALLDSHQDYLLEPPMYTRPAVFENLKVPEILLSGNFAQIDAWRDEQAWLKTQARRPDLVTKFEGISPTDAS